MRETERALLVVQLRINRAPIQLAPRGEPARKKKGDVRPGGVS